MARFFQRQGSTKVEVISEKRTDSPNIWWSNEQMQSHGFIECPGDAEAIKAAAVAAFDLRLFTDRLNVSFSGVELLALAPYYAVLKDQVAFPSFESAKRTLLGLVQAQIMTQEAYDKIAGLLLEQGIDLALFDEAIA
jgi:hypothetical protein